MQHMQMSMEENERDAMQKKLAVFYRVFVRIQNVYFGNE